MTVEISELAAQSGWLRIDIVGNATAAGLVGEVLNPEGALLHLYDGILYLEESAHAASTFNIGVAATGVDDDDIMSAFDVGTPVDGTVHKALGTDLASEATATTPKGLLWPADEYLTITSAAQVSTGLLASLFLRYIRIEDQ
jgi:hypothetical protein